jgi:hypothetical protein
VAKCRFCGKDVPQLELFPHFNKEHPKEWQEMRQKGKGSPREDKLKADITGDSRGTKWRHAGI